MLKLLVVVAAGLMGYLISMHFMGAQAVEKVAFVAPYLKWNITIGMLILTVCCLGAWKIVHGK